MVKSSRLPGSLSYGRNDHGLDAVDVTGLHARWTRLNCADHLFVLSSILVASYLSRRQRQETRVAPNQQGP